MPQLSGITVMCFAASYGVVLLLELVGLARRFAGQRQLTIGMAVAGLFAHTAYLSLHAVGRGQGLGSLTDWYLVVAWVLAGMYLLSILAARPSVWGICLLPAVLGTLLLAQFASDTPLAGTRAGRVWGQLHGGLLALATVTMTVGFLAGLLYLWQSWRLKQKLPPRPGFRLPTLEWLENVLGRALGLSTLLVAGGFLSGVFLSRSREAIAPGGSLLTDPVVLTSAAMLGWLLIAESFRLAYPAARQGRKVAYLTLAAFVFLAVTLAALTLGDRQHGRAVMAVESATTSEVVP